MKDLLEDRLKAECEVFAISMDEERHKKEDMTAVYRMIEDDIMDRYKVSRELVKEYVTHYRNRNE